MIHTHTQTHVFVHFIGRKAIMQHLEKGLSLHGDNKLLGLYLSSLTDAD